MTITFVCLEQCEEGEHPCLVNGVYVCIKDADEDCIEDSRVRARHNTLSLHTRMHAHIVHMHARAPQKLVVVPHDVLSLVFLTL